VVDSLLVLGGTGFIGRSVVNYAVMHGFIVTVLSLHIPKKEDKLDDVSYLQADISNLSQLKEILSYSTFNYVVNLSGYIDHSKFLGDGKRVVNIHFDGVQNLLQVLDWKKLKRFVQIGSSDEYGCQSAPQSEELRESPISPYSFAKVASTQLLQMLSHTENLPAVTLRLFLVYGTGQDNKRFLPQVIQGCLTDSHFSASEGKQLRDFCHIDDVVRGIFLSLKNDLVNGEIINLASGTPVTIRSVVERVQKIVGKGMPDFGVIPYRKGENMELYADISKAEKILSWKPEITLERGIERTVIEYREKISA